MRQKTGVAAGATGRSTGWEAGIAGDQTADREEGEAVVVGEGCSVRSGKGWEDSEAERPLALIQNR